MSTQIEGGFKVSLTDLYNEQITLGYCNTLEKAREICQMLKTWRDANQREFTGYMGEAKIYQFMHPANLYSDEETQIVLVETIEIF